MIELRHIYAGYGEKQILKDISLQCPSGTVTVLCGPNGCGKSTVLKVASRLLSPNSGELWLQGERTEHLSGRDFARQVAVMPQIRSSASLTAHSLVLHGRFPYLGYPRHYSREDKEIVKKAMDRTNTWKFASTPVAALSGGERQKVYLAMCLAQNTPILLLDEPTTYLDIQYQLELMELTKELARDGKAIFMVLHDLNLAMTYADQMIVMQNGTVLQKGSPQAIYESGVLEQTFHVKTQKVTLSEQRIQYFFTRML